MDLGTVIALSGLAIALIGHGFASVWWASKMTTILEGTQKSLTDIMIDLKAVSKTYVTKEDFAKEIGHIEKRVDAAWDKLDRISEK